MTLEPTERSRAAGRTAARVRPPRGRAAPPGVGGRRRGAARAAPRRPRSRGCSASRSRRRSAAQGGDLLDSVALQEALFEAGASSGLIAALFTGGIALPHIAAHGTPDLIDRFVRPTLAGEMIGSLAVTEPGGGSDVAGITHDAPSATATTTSSTAPRRSSPAGVRADFVTTAVRTGGPGPRRRQPARRSRRARPASPSTAALAKMGWHCSDTAELSFVDVRVPAANLVGEENTGFVPDRRAVRRRADRAGGARLRHRRPRRWP